MMSIMCGNTPRDTIKAMLDVGLIESPKQAWRTLEKWANKDMYDYGVSLDLGWLEDSNFWQRYQDRGGESNGPVFSTHDYSHPEIHSGHDMSFVLEHQLTRAGLM